MLFLPLDYCSTLLKRGKRHLSHQPGAQLLVHVNYGHFGPERQRFKWEPLSWATENENPNIMDISGRFLSEFITDPEIGKVFWLGPYRLRFLERSILMDSWRVIRDDNWISRVSYFYHRYGQALDLAYRRSVVTLGIWGLAELHPGAIPTWRDVYLFQRLLIFIQKVKEHGE
jgi:hypothetical protein